MPTQIKHVPLQPMKCPCSAPYDESSHHTVRADHQRRFCRHKDAIKHVGLGTRRRLHRVAKMQLLPQRSLQIVVAFAPCTATSSAPRHSPHTCRKIRLSYICMLGTRTISKLPNVSAIGRSALASPVRESQLRSRLEDALAIMRWNY